jgi:hypothetical protein
MRDAESGLEDMIIIEVTKRTMAAVMEESRYSEKGLKQGRRKCAGETFIKTWIKMIRKSPGDMHCA